MIINQQYPDISKSILFKNYPGNKSNSGCYQNIINLIPEHDIYIEAFAGSAIIFRYMSKSNLSVLIDKNYQVIKEWNSFSIPGLIAIYSDAISFISQLNLLANILKYFNLNLFLYCDPPYPISSRRSSKRIYKNEMSDLDHKRFLAEVSNLNVNCLVSSYPNELYSQSLSSWNTKTFDVTTHKGKATEILYYNYQTPDKLHDYSYIGDDFRDRYRIKGIINRNIEKFSKLKKVEQNAIIKSLSNHFQC
jgi:DNA adenine methylase